MGDHGGHSGPPGEPCHVGALVFGGERHDRAARTGAGGASRPVEVGLVFQGRIGVDHELDVVDVQAAGCDVGRDQDGRAAGAERVEVAHPRCLGEVAVYLESRHTGRYQLAGARSRVRCLVRVSTTLRPGVEVRSMRTGNCSVTETCITERAGPGDGLALTTGLDR